jgi:5-(carboxyamino)imidazole ribonucleotide synthase
MINGPDEIPESVANLLVEAQVPIVRELAAVVARRPSGEVAVWPVVETVQRDGMCVEVVAPAPDLPAQTATTAQDIARTIAVQLDVTGVLAVELFQTSAGLLVNELAMRPHNSAHWTIEGATTSQFEQHLRAVLDWPLGGTDPTHPWTVMVNVVGSSVDPATVLPAALGDDPGLHVHLYGKRARPGRKLGHVTVTGDDLSAVLQRARRGAGLLAGNESG